MKFGTDPDTAEVVRQRSAQRSAHKMRFGLLWLPAVAALSIAPQYADVHGGAALELVLDTPAPDLQRPHCIIGGVWVPAVLLQSGATLRCTVPAAPGLAAGAVTVQAGERGESDDLILDGEGEATLVYYEAAELPSLSTLYPPAGLAATPTEVRMIGTNFAPLGVDARCAFGADGLTTATFISPTAPRLWWRARPGLRTAATPWAGPVPSRRLGLSFQAPSPRRRA